MYSWEIDNKLKENHYWFDTYYDFEKMRMLSPQIYRIEIIDDNEERVKLQVSTKDNWTWSVYIKHENKY